MDLTVDIQMLKALIQKDLKRVDTLEQKSFVWGQWCGLINGLRLAKDLAAELLEKPQRDKFWQELDDVETGYRKALNFPEPKTKYGHIPADKMPAMKEWMQNDPTK